MSMPANPAVVVVPSAPELDRRIAEDHCVVDSGVWVRAIALEVVEPPD